MTFCCFLVRDHHIFIGQIKNVILCVHLFESHKKTETPLEGLVVPGWEVKGLGGGVSHCGFGTHFGLFCHCFYFCGFL